jgi:glyceraldehyde 3-phosphate dehydrogenase
MAKTRVGINGFGRIGRNFLRAALERSGDFEIVAFNDLGDIETMAHLLRYDSVLGRFGEEVEVKGGSLTVAGKEITGLAERDPAALPWGDLGVEVVIESTGFFTARDGAQKHLDAGAKKVIISAPGKEPDITLVLGVNDGEYDAEQHSIISMASCTTNCIAPMAKILDEGWGIEHGFMTTIHAYTNDQNVLDLPHKDLRRAHAAAINLIPTSTGAARAIGVVLPQLKGKVDGVAVRAPVATGSLVDFVVHLGRPATVEEINGAFEQAASAGPLAPYLEYSSEPLVSTAIVHSPASCTFDSGLTMASGTFVKVFGWYDNEWGYSCRLVDLVPKIVA